MSLNFKKFNIFILFLIVFSFFSVSLSAQETKITNFIVNKKENKIFISFSTENAFSKSITNLIQSGTPVTFSFDIKVEKQRRFFPNKTIYKKEIIHKIKYSSLTKTFFIIKPYISEEPYVINSKTRVKSEMTTITDFEVELPLKSKGNHLVYARARLQEVILPFYMHKVFFFLSAWDFKTDWANQNIEI
ncbi:MAG: DUF4390 domain-containing protein [Desulforegulaceae bacterium]|nr:DUF4390 domain-containing protein [Desulforegulaceae bacterium]